MTLKRRQHLMACAAYRAGAAISSNLATGSTDAMHADRRLFLLAASDLEGRPLNYFIDACANALVEAQRAARYLIYLHVSKAAGTSLCKLASRNRCRAPPRFSTLWAPGDGFVLPRPFFAFDGFADLHTNAVAATRHPTQVRPGATARARSVVHESKESVGKGRRARCAAVERSCESRRAIFERNNYELMAIERWADNGGAVCSPDIWHATLFRDPLDRIVSHHNHLWSTILRARPRKHEKVRSLCLMSILGACSRMMARVSRRRSYSYDGSTASDGLRLVHGLRAVVGLSNQNFPRLVESSRLPSGRLIHAGSSPLDRARRPRHRRRELSGARLYHTAL